MPQRARQRAIRLFRSWAMTLVGISLLGVGGNVFLAQRVMLWRDLNPGMHWERAEQLAYRKDFGEALKEARRAIELAPNRHEPYIVSGNIYYMMKEWDKSLEMYKRADAINPDLISVKERIFWCLMSLKRFDEAAEYGERLLTTGKTSKDLPKYIASAWSQAGQASKAIALLENELALAPKNIEIMTRLIATYRQVGRHEDADQLTIRLAEAQAERDALLNLGE